MQEPCEVSIDISVSLSRDGPHEVHSNLYLQRHPPHGSPIEVRLGVYASYDMQLIRLPLKCGADLIRPIT
ncbi:Uncharacterized protein TCM_013549 [Theobroma cacao]|uniref:Uncharacterized protein n=1 Tax=Theobroma cacao TaxID=3641 RepID=A0A061FVQ3_THECC|nr:Uncharacterized protein TCM_013549 [Theobroma cacao]